MKLNKGKWDKVKIKDVTTEMKAGFSSGKFELDSGQIAHLRTMNISDECKLVWNSTKYITREIFEKNDSLQLKKGDVLFNNTNSTELVGKSCYVYDDIECGFSNHITRVRVNENLLNSYYLYVIFGAYFKNRTFESYCQKWVGQSGINRSILGNIEIPLPPLEEQKQIAALFQSIEAAMEQVDGQEKNLHLLLQNLINDLVSESSKIRKGKLKNIVFGDIASNISERAEPQNSIGQIFVGLDHIDSREIKIERFGKPDSLIGTKLKVYEGDIIFGKRNAYLRKAAISTFNGICSAHAMVLRANEKKIHKDYLPFFMHSDSFMMRAKEISEGSISPTIKWKNLERQEFFIPEIEDQKIFTKLFQEIENIRQQLKQQKATLKLLKQKLLNEILG